MTVPDPPDPFHALDPRPGKYDSLAVWLRRALVLVAVLAVAAVLLPPEQGVWVGRALVVVLVAVPLLRVAWFVVRWFRRGDPRFALVGLGVLCVVACGYLLS